MSNLMRRYEDLHPQQSQTTVQDISKEIAKQLKVNGEKPVVVFAVDKNGAIQPYKVEGTFSDCGNESADREFPLPAGDIEFMETLTLFATSNPKFCWVDTTGKLKCVNY